MRIIKFFNHQILLLLFPIGVQYVFELMQIAVKVQDLCNKILHKNKVALKLISEANYK